MMIKIGLAGWGDHPTLYAGGSYARNKLEQYSAHFPVVEVDTSFYAIQPERNYEKWVKQTPDGFSFVIKAYQGMTGHARGDSPTSNEAMFALFKASIEPVIQAGKLTAVLFQYPPWFDCTKEHVNLLRYAKEQMGGIPAALEFRNQTWFVPGMRERTLAFMEQEGWIHSVCDEPQAGIGSVPLVLKPTHPELTIVRMHGRNIHGWNNHGQPNWRDVRYLYRYNRQELNEWKQHLEELTEGSRQICMLFNNNSGGDAADNAREMLDLLGIQYEGLAPRQLDLF